MSNMLTVHQEQIKNMVNLYGAYEVTKALKDCAIDISDEYIENGNVMAVVHEDAYFLSQACQLMAAKHPLRSKDVPQ